MADDRIAHIAASANNQVASEAFLTAAGIGNSDALRGTIIQGNENVSRFPNSIATDFSDHVSVIAHVDLSLNISKNPLGATVSDKSGLSATLFFDENLQQYTLSIRSTEASLGLTEGSENILDPGDVKADLEIVQYGYAFAQIADLQTFYESQVRPIVGNAQINVTGYSLGGHLAAVFTELYRDQVSHAYLFNAAGTGAVVGGGGFRPVLDIYVSTFADPTAFFGNDPTAASDVDVRTQLALYLAEPERAYESVYDNPRHKLAIMAASQYTVGAASTTLTGGRVADEKISDIIGENGLTATAATGIRHGESIPVFIESQPAVSGDDFGAGHSIVLLQDSLALAALFEKLDPEFTLESFNRILEAGADRSWASLERTLDSLRALIRGTDKSDPGLQTPSGNSPTEFSNINLRDQFYANLLAQDQVIDNEGLAGTVTIVPLDGAGAGSLAALARSEISYRYALRELNSFAVLGFDYSARNASGELEYGGSSGPGLTDRWIDSRADFLGKLVAYNIADGDLSPNAIEARFEDLRQGIGIGSLLVDRNVFAGDQGNNVRGEGRNDRLFGGAGADSMTGGAGNDYLEGRGGADALSGGAGDDTLIGLDGEGGDILRGGTGYDTYYADWGDTIGDDPESPRGGIVYVGADQLELGEGARREGDSYFRGAGGVRYWEGPGGQINVFYEGSARELIIEAPSGAVPGHEQAGDLVISGRPDLGIRLVTQLEAEPRAEGVSTSVAGLWHLAQTWVPRADPLALDLDGDGLETQGGLEGGAILFDHSGDGVRDGTGWLTGDDAWVALDRDGDGLISSGAELFGVNTLLPDGSSGADGFAALAPLDTNRDGVVDANDAPLEAWQIRRDLDGDGFVADGELRAASFADLVLWQDADLNGLSDPFEVHGFAEAGIAGIRLDAVPDGHVLPGGNTLLRRGVFLRTDGTSGLAGALDLVRETFYREFAVPPTAAPTVDALPNFSGSGRVRDLEEAVAESPALSQALSDAAAAQTRAAQIALTATMLSEWAGSSPMAAGSQAALERADRPVLYYQFAGLVSDTLGNAYLAATGGTALDPASLPPDWYAARQSDAYRERLHKLEVLERFVGQTFADVDGLASMPVTPIGDIELRGIAVPIRAENWQYLERAYASLEESAYLAIATQTRLADYVDAFAQGQATRDFSEVEALLESKRAADPAVALGDFVDLSRALGTGLVERGWVTMPAMLERWLREAQEDPALAPALASLPLQFRERAQMAGGPLGDVLLGTGAPLDSAFVRTYGDFGDDLIFGGDPHGVEIYDGPGRDVILGGAEQNVYFGGAGHDIYLFGRGSGSDTLRPEVIANTTTALDRDTLQFLPGVAPEDAIVRAIDSAALEIRIAGTGDTFVDQYFAYGQTVDNGLRMLDEVRFADGTLWNLQTLRAKAMEGSEGDDGGGSGARALRGYADSNDLIEGRGGNDSLIGAAGDDILRGGEGDDVLEGELGDDLLDGGPGNDKLYGGLGLDTYLLRRDGGSDEVFKGNAFTFFNFGLSTERDTVRVEDGISPEDVLLQRQARSLRIFLADGSAELLDHGNLLLPAIGDVQPTIARIEFGDGTVWDAGEIRTRALLGATGAADTLYGYDDSDDVLQGLGGNDTLFGLGGDDELTGGPGDDRLEGGPGSDTYVFGRGDGQDFIEDRDGAPGKLRLTDVNPGELTRVGGFLRIVDTDDSITLSGGGHEIEQVIFADGTVSTLEALPEPAAAPPPPRDPVEGEEEPPGFEPPPPGPGGATDGDDHIFGTPGPDILAGGRGFDILEGGGGRDTYRYNLGDGLDVIIDANDEAGPNEIEFGAGIRPEDLSIEIEEEGAAFIRVATDGQGIAILGDVPEFRFSPVSEPVEPEPEPEVGSPAPTETPSETQVQPAAASAIDVSAPLAIAAPPPPAPKPEAIAELAQPPAPRADPPRVGVPLDPHFREVQQRFDVLLQTGRTNLGERYADAVREFEERRVRREEAPLPPPPAPDEVEAWNSAMHAWHERNPGFAETDLGASDGTWSMGWGVPAAGERLLDGATGAGPVPGLANPHALPRLGGAGAAPGLSEGLRELR